MSAFPRRLQHATPVVCSVRGYFSDQETSDKLGSAKQGTSGVAKGLEGAVLGDVGEKNTYSVSRKGKKEKTKQTKQTKTKNR